MPASAKSAPKRLKQMTVVNQEHLAELCDAIKAGVLHRDGHKAKDYAEKWGLSTHRVYELTAKANAMVAAQIRDPVRAAALVGSRMERIVRDGEDRDATQAGKLLANLAGLALANTNINIGAPGKPLDVGDPAALQTLATRIRERLTPEAVTELARLLGSGDVRELGE